MGLTFTLRLLFLANVPSEDLAATNEADGCL